MYKRSGKTQPAVKSVSKLINKKSHKQKKYLTLMLVPTYSTGKTFSFRIPRFAFQCVVYCLIALCLITAAFYVRANHLILEAQDLAAAIDETNEVFNEYRRDTENVQRGLVNEAVLAYEQLSDGRRLFQAELRDQEQWHQYDLNALADYVGLLEDIIEQFNNERLEMIEHLRARSIIPPLVKLLHQLEESQIHIYEAGRDISEAAVIGLIAMRENYVSVETLHGRLTSLLDELDLQQQLLDALDYYRELMDYYADRILGFNPERTNAYGVELLPWSYARRLFRTGVAVQITDVRTGITYYVNSFSNGNHADVRPVTAEDTAALLRTFNGTWSWNTRPILVHIDDRVFAASINGMPHGGGSLPGNNMRGHICIHFYGSRTHSGSRVHERDHQNSVREAFRASR